MELCTFPAIFPGRPVPFEVFRAVFPYAANRHFVCRIDGLLVEVAKIADFSKNKFREYGKNPCKIVFDPV